MSSSISDVQEYLSLEPLETRIQTHRQYSESPDDVEAAVARAVVLGTRDDLLDVGCGTGSYLRRLSVAGHQGQLVGLDASPAAIAALDGVDGVSAHLGDAAALPFRDSVFDTVTARHMLYHVPDVTGAITEARRVLRPGGRFAAIVNHPDVTPRVSALVRDVVTAAGVRIPVVPNSRLHSGNLPEMIGATFGDVVVHRYDNALVFDRPEPVIAFTLAQLSFYGVEPDSPLRLELARVIDGRSEAGSPTRPSRGAIPRGTWSVWHDGSHSDVPDGLEDRGKQRDSVGGRS